MATLVLDDAYININANDLSADGNQVSLSYDADALEKTAFGDDTHVHQGGLKNWSMEMTFHQNFADNDLDEILFALVGTSVTVAIRPTSASKGASNPEYTGTGLIQSYKPFGNAVGELASASISIVAAGTLSRAVA